MPSCPPRRFAACSAVLRSAVWRSAVLLTTSFILASCGSSDNRDAGASKIVHAQAQKLRVVATFYPLAWMAQQIGGQTVDVANLTPPGVEPHDLELAPDQVDALLDADVAVVLGRGFQPGPEKIAADRTRPTVIAFDAVGELPANQRNDPHLWLDPIEFSSIRTALVAALSAQRPALAADFARRSDALGAELSQLDADMASGLKSCARRMIVTNHEAFGHLARRYLLKQESIAGLSPDAEPDPQRLDDLAALVKKNGVTTVFTESLAPKEFAETLAREVGVRTVTLDPLEGPTNDKIRHGGTYLTIMRENLAALRAALTCTMPA